MAGDGIGTREEWLAARREPLEAEKTHFRRGDEIARTRQCAALALQDGVVHHTYSTYACGVEALMGTYQHLDLAPVGRNEPPFWWRRHDDYGTA